MPSPLAIELYASDQRSCGVLHWFQLALEKGKAVRSVWVAVDVRREVKPTSGLVDRCLENPGIVRDNTQPDVLSMNGSDKAVCIKVGLDFRQDRLQSLLELWVLVKEVESQHPRLKQ